jgi:ABC-2 type transport system permease protein
MLLVRRQVRVNRTLLIVLTVVVAINNVVQVTSYNSIFPNAATRASTLAGFTSNTALRVFYGYPFDISSPAGWLAWRALGFAVIVVAIWAAFITAGALRGEEESGRAELVLSQPPSRNRWFFSALTAVILEAGVVGLVNALALTAICATKGLMTVGQCLASSLELVVPAVLFAFVGALTSQLFTTTRAARIAATALVLVAVLLRTVADAGTGVAWLRWTSPLGWAEELRPSSTPSLAALLLSVGACIVVVVMTLPLLRSRDIGRGLIPPRDSRTPRRFLLRNTWQEALRDELPQLSLWLAGSLVYMAIMGGLAKTLLDLVHKNHAVGSVLGSGFALNAYMAATFSLVELFTTLLVATTLRGARGEEASGRLEVVFAQPLTRTSWILGRAILAACVALALAVLSSVALWITIEATGETVSFAALLQAALNCIPLIVLTVGVGVALLGFAPRATAVLYGLVTVAFLWDALGTAIKAPTWALNLSPFHALAAIPAQDFSLLPAIVLAVIGVAAVGVGSAGFRDRDLAMG